jgi:hypothetical protein
MEVARVDARGVAVRAEGTQLGATYELRYRLDADVLSLELVGDRSVEVDLGDADFFDLGLSPLFNSLPVIRDALLDGEGVHEYEMSWVEVPSLAVSRSKQLYEPLGHNVVRYRSGTFMADIVFDSDGFVTDYPGLARRV